MKPAAGQFRQIGRRVKAMLGPRVVVLLYHRIGDPAAGGDPHRLSVSPGRFAEHVQVLRDFGPVLQLPDLARALLERSLPRRGTVVTFDDGYADNLHVAKPLLERYDVPATVFVTTGSIGREREFWWDELQGVLLEPGALPRMLRLNVGGRSYEWDLGGMAEYGPPDIGRYAAWDFEVGDDPGPRQQAFRGVYELLWDLTETERRAVLDDLLAWAGAAPTVRPTHRAMTDDEVIQLADGGLIEVGGHTHTHPNLAARPSREQQDEIVKCKARLDDVLGRPVESFAYPFGLHTDESVRFVHEAGFSRACACLGHAVRHGSELFRLTRADLGDCDGDTFARRLRDAVSW